MATTMVSAGKRTAVSSGNSEAKAQLFESILRLTDWLEENDYQAYDTFDGLNARFVRPFTFEKWYLRMALQQGVRRFPLNLRPLLGVKKAHSTKGMGFIARGFIRLNQATGESVWNQRAQETLEWLINHTCAGFHGTGWGNHFDYQSRNCFVKKNNPSIVWTSLVGHAFLDAYEHFQDEKYLKIAVSSCEHIMTDIERHVGDGWMCFGYFPKQSHQVHNANVLGGGLLARTYSFMGNQEMRDLAELSLAYTAQYQRPEGYWYYGEASNLRWVDNFHTGYVLDCFKHYGEGTGDTRFEKHLAKGYRYWKENFFLPDGTPKYYDSKTLPIDIQCASQAIDTLVFFSDRDPEALELALRVARWTIQHMQDRSGYFYYRRYPLGIVNKTPTLHWGQATMLAALAALHRAL